MAEISQTPTTATKHMSMQTHTYVYAELYMHIYVFIYIYVYTHIFIHKITYTYIYIYIHIIYTYIHTCNTYIHTYIHVANTVDKSWWVKLVNQSVAGNKYQTTASSLQNQSALCGLVNDNMGPTIMNHWQCHPKLMVSFECFIYVTYFLKTL